MCWKGAEDNATGRYVNLDYFTILEVAVCASELTLDLDSITQRIRQQRLQWIPLNLRILA